VKPGEDGRMFIATWKVVDTLLLLISTLTSLKSCWDSRRTRWSRTKVF